MARAAGDGRVRHHRRLPGHSQTRRDRGLTVLASLAEMRDEGWGVSDAALRLACPTSLIPHPSHPTSKVLASLAEMRHEGWGVSDAALRLACPTSLIPHPSHPTP